MAAAATPKPAKNIITPMNRIDHLSLWDRPKGLEGLSTWALLPTKFLSLDDLLKIPNNSKNRLGRAKISIIGSAKNAPPTAPTRIDEIGLVFEKSETEVRDDLKTACPTSKKTAPKKDVHAACANRLARHARKNIKCFRNSGRNIFEPDKARV